MKPHLHCYTGKKNEHGDKTSSRVKLGFFWRFGGYHLMIIMELFYGALL